MVVIEGIPVTGIQRGGRTTNENRVRDELLQPGSRLQNGSQFRIVLLRW